MPLRTLRAAAPAALALAVLASCSDDGLVNAPEAGALRATASTTGPQLVITEIMSDPAVISDANGEWFEVYNAGTAAVDLQGYEVRSGPSGSDDFIVNTSLVVAPGGYLVFGPNTNTATNGGVTIHYATPPSNSFALNNSNTDWLSIKTPAGVLVDSVAYVDRTLSPLPSYSPPSGRSRAVIDVCRDNSVVAGSNWATSTTPYTTGNSGTPGTGPYTTCEVGGEVASVVVTPSTATAVKGKTQQFTASGFDVQGRPAAPTVFTWSVSDTRVASVNAGTGLVTALDSGTVIVTATAANGVAGAGTLSVSLFGQVGSVSISINNPAQAPVGYTKPAFPTVRDGDNAVISPAPPLAWTSSDPSVATVDSLGYITGVSPGTATIRATAPGGAFGERPFTVIPADAPTSAVYLDHVSFGVPTDGTPGDEHLVSKRQYVASWNAARGGPNWVSWNINATHFGAAPRCDCFSWDQTLPSSFPVVVDFNYRNGGYDRGHMVQSESRTTTDQENASTFLLTNILPQAGENNQGPWSRFENYLNDLARQQNKEIYVVAGGEYAATPPTLKNEGRVAIPDYTWKVAVIVDRGEGAEDIIGHEEVNLIAIRMPNLTTTGGPASAVGIRNNPWEMYRTTVDAIEAAVGYDLLSALPDRLERILESGDRFPVAAVDGPLTGVEGSTVFFSAAGSTDPDGDALTYEWDFGDGSTGTGATPQHTYADNGSYPVKVVVTDPYGAADSVTTTVTVVNVAPTVSVFAGATLLAGETYTGASTFADPGADGWTATVDYGDGSGAQPLVLSGNGFSLSHAYAAAGTYTVTVRVTDDDGDTGVRTATVTVQSAAQGVQTLQAIVSTFQRAGLLSAGNANALEAKLRAAGQSLARGDETPAVNQVEAFVNQVEALVASGHLSASDAEGLLAQARRVIRSIQS